MAGIGFFAPLPLALMLPFMAGQSMLMGDAFGKSYQYGKRKISAMSNEEFNALTPADLAQDITADFKALIPELEIAMQESRRFQGQILKEMGEIIKDLPQVIKDFFNFTGGELPTGQETITEPPPPTSGSIYDFIGKVWNNIFVGNLLSGIGISTASSNYLALKGHVENFLAGVGIMNKRIIDDAVTNAKNFLDNLTPPATETEPEPETELEEVKPTEEQLSLKLPLDFIGSLTLGDMATGGHRHRNYKGKLLHFIIIEKITHLSQRVRTFRWTNQRWSNFGTYPEGNRNHAINIVNQRKHAHDASYVLQFGNEFYLIKEHT